MKRGIILLTLVCLPLAACGKRGPRDVAPAEPPPAPIVPGQGKGLSASDRQQFYHLPEGSEVFPLPWMRALESVSTGQPFMNGLDRFGLIPDPNNPDGLPVGITATPSRDTRFLDLKMVGVNCAACHVNELKVGDKTVRIDGAPSLFDLGAFYGDLIESSLATAKSPAKLFQFLRTLAHQPEKTTLAESAAPRPRALIARAFADLASLRAAGEMEKGMADALDALIKAEHALPPVNLGAKMSTTKQGGTDFLSGQADASKHWKGKKPGAGSPLAKIASPEVLAARVLPAWLNEARVVIRLLRARGQFLQTLVQIQGGTSIGPGRIDAFGGARNLIFRPTPLDPSSAPVSYPHLWGFGDTVWLHWDANTTSVMERNIGQSLGLGAIFNPKTHESTVLPRNLHSLEVLADKLAAPAWPADVFGKIDADRAKRGEKLFGSQCATCHVEKGKDDPDKDGLLPLDTIGTDPARALSFAKPLNGQPFSDALADALGKIKRQAYADAKISPDEAKEFDGTRGVKWRATGRYARRPLVAIWATPPYLHNNSVPTLYDLLLPPAERPATFPLGQRDYDVKKLGYATAGVGAPRFTYDTAKAGNHNTGHDYGTHLSEDERYDLLEYLKSR